MIHPDTPHEVVTRTNGFATFRYLVVENQHRRRLATDCRCFLQRFERLAGDTVPTAIRDHVEQKWAGVLFNQAIAIAPRTSRRVAAFHTENDLAAIFFHQFCIDTDSRAVAQPFQGKGVYELEYVIVSSNFAPASRTFRLTIDGSIDRITLESVPLDD